MLFTIILNLYFEKYNASAICVIAHLGLPATARYQYIGVSGSSTKLIAQCIRIGALAVLRVTTNPSVKGGEFYSSK